MSVVGDTVLEVQDDGAEASMTTQAILKKLEAREFSLNALVRTSTTEQWSRLMSRPEFIELSPAIQFNVDKGPQKAGGGFIRGSDARIVADMMRDYRKNKQFPKLGFFFPAVILGSLTVLQGLQMFRLYSHLYTFFSCDNFVLPGGEMGMTVGVVKLNPELATSTNLLIEGATVSEKSRDAMAFNFLPGHYDIRYIRLIAPESGERALSR